MPTIPLPSLQPMADAAVPVMDRERRPTMDTSGVQQALLQYNEAQKMPLLDARDFLAPYGALENLGQAISSVGGDLARVSANKEREALSINQTGAYQAKMQAEMDEYESWRGSNKEQPEQWVDKGVSRIKALQAAAEADKSLTREARQNVRHFLQTGGSDWLQRIDVEAKQAQFGKARSVIQTHASNAFNQGDRVRGVALLNQGREAGYFNAKEVSKYEIDGLFQATQSSLKAVQVQADKLAGEGRYDHALQLVSAMEVPSQKDPSYARFESGRASLLGDLQRRQSVSTDMDRFNEVLDLDPTEALRQLSGTDVFPNLKGVQREELKREALLAHDAAADAEFSTSLRVLDDVPAGGLKGATPASLNMSFKQLRPDHLSIIQDAIDLRNGEVSYPTYFAKLRAQAGAFQPTGDAEEDTLAAAQIERQASLLPARQQQAVQAQLKAAMSGSADSVRHGGAVLKATELVLEKGVFGSLSQAVLGEDGRPVMREPRLLGRTPVKKKSLFGVDWLWPDGGGEDVWENGHKPVAMRRVDAAATERAHGMLERALSKHAALSRVAGNEKWTPEQSRDQMISILLDMGAGMSGRYRDVRPVLSRRLGSGVRGSL